MGDLAMRGMIVVAVCFAATGCTIETVSPPGIVMTRAIAVHPRDVMVFADLVGVPARYSVVDEVWIRDDGDMSPREMESRLRVQAGARGANAIIMDKLNRRDNGTRVDLGLRLDDPFEYYSATAIWIGEGERPEKYLGTLGGGKRRQ